jgi:hypothetical protein
LPASRSGSFFFFANLLELKYGAAASEGNQPEDSRQTEEHPTTYPGYRVLE